MKPLLAATAEDLSALRYPLLVSPKLDGIRCLIVNGEAVSRTLKPIPNNHVRKILCGSPSGLDGELMLRGSKTRPFEEISSAIMSREGSPDFVFRTFDFYSEAPFSTRYDRMLEIVGTHEYIQPVPHRWVRNEEELRAECEIHLDMGYEGTMLRDPNGRYKFGRSTLKEGILLKVKPFADEEAVVVHLIEMQHNENEATINALGQTERSSHKAGKRPAGKLGALVCVTEDGAEFEIGTGFTDAQRIEWWKQNLVGRLVKFKHQPPPGGRAAGQAPRFPVFLGWRLD